MASSIYERLRSDVATRRRGFESRAMRAAPTAGLAMGLAAGSESPFATDSHVRDSRQKRSYELFRNWTYVCVNAVARRLAGQPVGAASLDDASPNPDRAVAPSSIKQVKIRQAMPSAIREKAAKEGEITQLYDHPVLDVLARPNSVQHKFEFLYFSAANLLLTGECYWIGGAVGDGDEARVEMWAVPSRWVQPSHKGGLFTGYTVKLQNNNEPIHLPPENVARTYFPDPADIRLAYAPGQAVFQATRTDDFIQTSQLEAFERGIFPNVLLSVGRVRGPDGKATDMRPRLSGPQRRQIIRAVRQIWNTTANYGEPGIIDGLIEDVKKLQLTPQEMDWGVSGDIVKRRIMQAYGVNPISVGEIVGANRAQAVEADKQMCSMAVNPIASALSESATDFLGPMWDDPARLVVWIDQAEPIDLDLQLARWTLARQTNDVTADELRSEILGLAPLPEDTPSPLVYSDAGIAAINNLLRDVGHYLITPEQAKVVLMTTMRLSETVAEAMVRPSQSLPAPSPPQPPPEPVPPPKPSEPDEGDGGEDQDELNDGDEENRAIVAGLSGSLQAVADAIRLSSVASTAAD